MILFKPVIRERDHYPFCFYGIGPRQARSEAIVAALGWATDAFGPSGTRWYLGSNGNTFRFRDRADAAAFRLMWT